MIFNFYTKVTIILHIFTVLVNAQQQKGLVIALHLGFIMHPQNSQLLLII